MSAKGGNVERATKIFAEHGDFIRSIINFNVKNKALSDDLFQDLFLYFISKSIPTEIRYMKGFLYKVTTDRIKDAFRRTGRYQAKLHRYANQRKSVPEREPEKAMIDIEETEKMFKAIARHLPSNEAIAVTLRYMDDNSITEIAEKMKIKPRSVSRYISVGLKKISYLFGTRQGGNHGND
ncbi:MAG: sigma-70 family RNA polymerase sigma factor [Planctomycetes bacterium]|nr:sigma-70 family RNA polymerase sigma factor [Planctomycetota bacterium]